MGRNQLLTNWHPTSTESRLGFSQSNASNRKSWPSGPSDALHVRLIQGGHKRSQLDHCKRRRKRSLFEVLQPRKGSCVPVSCLKSDSLDFSPPCRQTLSGLHESHKKSERGPVQHPCHSPVLCWPAPPSRMRGTCKLHVRFGWASLPGVTMI